MKKLLVAFCLSLTLLVGCDKTSPVKPDTVPAGVLSEKDAGKLFAVQKGSKVTFSFKTQIGDEFFWSVGKMNGDFEVLSDARVGDKQNIAIVVGSTGSILFDYVQFTTTGAKKLNQLTFSLKVE